jgi:hypothetical protein
MKTLFHATEHLIASLVLKNNLVPLWLVVMPQLGRASQTD